MLESNVGIKSCKLFFNGLFKINPTAPFSLYSANNSTDLLKETSPIIAGSATNNNPFSGFKIVILLFSNLKLSINCMKYKF